MLRWARSRSDQSIGDLSKRFPRLEAWERGDSQPTLKQLERFAKATYTPIGFLFLSDPPRESLPVPDFRTVRNEDVSRPSPNLLDTLYHCQQRQEWYRNFARAGAESPLELVGAGTVGDDVEKTAEKMRAAFGDDLAERQRSRNWEEALTAMVDRFEAAGVLVNRSGIVGSNTRRKLDPDEFRGFALVDPLAPLIFVNGADTKAAQMFTLVHELAHIWVGLTGVTNLGPVSFPKQGVEAWCNQVTAEFLVPLAALRDLEIGQPGRSTLDRLARHFKVSTLVILRRLHDFGFLTRAQLRDLYREELEFLSSKTPEGGGGSFYPTQAARVGKRFARALIVSTLGGQTLHRDAFALLGVRKLETFREFGRSVGVPN
jgi:Zn-dependent peptidase ImmA (M78 family)